MLIRAQRLADFVVRPANASVHCYPFPGSSAAAVRHFLLNQMLPRLVSAREPLVIHASAVHVKGGAIAMMGSSGLGKSTLASSFPSSGTGTLVADDGIIVRVTGSSPSLVGAYACPRLQTDSVDALGLSEHSTSLERPPWAKHTLMMAPDRRVATSPVLVRGFFLLRSPCPDQRDIVVAPLIGFSAVIALIENSFLIDSSDRGLIRRQFEAASALIRTGCPVYSLTYPRRFADLPQVRARILSALRD